MVNEEMNLAVDIKKKLGDFSLDVQFQSESKRIGILGASGCGKSMTLKSIAGIETPDAGRIQIGDHILFDRASGQNRKPQKRNIGYLFQNYALFPTMTVEKNIAAGLKGSKAENQKRVREMIEKFQLNGLAKRLPGELSGGQQQRVAIARALAAKPAILLADEPTGNLDSRTSQDVLGLLKVTGERFGQTIVMITHNEEIAQLADRIIRIEDGKIKYAKERTARRIEKNKGGEYHA